MSLDTFEKLPEEKKQLIIDTGIRAFSEKSYQDVSTDSITQSCRISKGILFHYFGSKKAYYLYCLEKSMERLTAKTEMVVRNNFYDILFAGMNRKLSQCQLYRDEMHMVNMASRDPSREIAKEKAELLQRYAVVIHKESTLILTKAVSKLKFKNEENRQKNVDGLRIYINALLNRYLLKYQNTPDLFFDNMEQIRAELKAYLDLMLYGICD